MTFCTLTDSVTTISDISEYISTVKEGEHITTVTGDSPFLSTKVTRILQNQYLISTIISSSRSKSVNESGYFQLYKTSTDGSLMENQLLESTSDASILIASRSIRATEHEPSRRVADFSSTQMGMVASEPKDPKYHLISDRSTGNPFTILNNRSAVTPETHFSRTTKEVSNSSDNDEYAGICSNSLCRNGGTCEAKKKIFGQLYSKLPGYWL